MRVAALVVGGVGCVVGFVLSVRTVGFGAIGILAGSSPSYLTVLLGALISVCYLLAAGSLLLFGMRSAGSFSSAGALLLFAIGVAVFGYFLFPSAPVIETIGFVSLFTLPVFSTLLLLVAALLIFLESRMK